MRKRILKTEATPSSRARDIASMATALITSEKEEHPIENAFDASRGPGGSRWIAGEPGDQTLVLEFDTPQSLEAVTLEIEEREASRTQELTLSISRDGGESYSECVRQEYNFSPGGSTFERETWRLGKSGVTHLKLWIRPDKGGGPSLATLTSLALQ